MAGLSTTFHHAYIAKPPLSMPSHAAFIRIRNPNDSIRSPTVTISARYGGAGRGGGFSRTYQSDDDEALDLSSIRSDSVRLIDQQQKMVGVVSKAQAIQMADDAELDLVILSPEADPPVVRIMDFNKYRYEQQKKKRDQQKKSAASRMDLKELKMGYNIDVHDYSVRLKAARKFLKDGDKVKVIVNLKGRENELEIMLLSYSDGSKMISGVRNRGKQRSQRQEHVHSVDTEQGRCAEISRTAKQ